MSLSRIFSKLLLLLNEYIWPFDTFLSFFWYGLPFSYILRLPHTLSSLHEHRASSTLKAIWVLQLIRICCNGVRPTWNKILWTSVNIVGKLDMNWKRMYRMRKVRNTNFFLSSILNPPHNTTTMILKAYLSLSPCLLISSRHTYI